MCLYLFERVTEIFCRFTPQKATTALVSRVPWQKVSPGRPCQCVGTVRLSSSRHGRPQAYWGFFGTPCFVCHASQGTSVQVETWLWGVNHQTQDASVSASIHCLISLNDHNGWCWPGGRQEKGPLSGTPTGQQGPTARQLPLLLQDSFI